MFVIKIKLLLLKIPISFKDLKDEKNPIKQKCIIIVPLGFKMI